MSGSLEQSMEAAIKDAESKGFTVYRSDSTHLLLDLDTPGAVEQYNKVFHVVDELYGVTKVESWSSKSGNVHKYLTLDRAVGPGTRLGLHAMLGSDGLREALALRRLNDGINEPSILFRPGKLVPTNAT